MILKSSFVAVIFCTLWFERASGISYSKVYVQSGPDVIPVDYVNYGAPQVQVPSAQLAQLSAAPAGSVLPVRQVANFAPCIAPCIIQAPAIASVPVGNAKMVAYKAPASVPVVVAQTKEEPTKYEYSYVVYDENTGDQKAQKELSDGSVVRGQYSLIQPDGYVREVQYVADDLTGFNAVVKNFLPEDANKNINTTAQKAQPNNPCPEVKKEALKEEPKPEVAPRKEDVQTVEPLNVQNADIEVLPKAEEATAAVVKPVIDEKPKAVEKQPAKDTQKAVDHPKIHERVEIVSVPAVQKKQRPPGHSAETSDEHADHDDTDTLNPTVPADKAVVTNVIDAPTVNNLSLYGDILKCIKLAVDANAAGKGGMSPLTYVLLPYTKC